MGVLVRCVLLAGLWYALYVTKDWRRRALYADKTAHLSDEEVRQAYRNNMAVVAAYHHAEYPKPSARVAENALTMASVLRERIDSAEGRRPMGYLRSRRVLLREVR